MKNISILGATGSIGTQTLDVLRCEKDKFKLICATANKSWAKMIDIIEEFSPAFVGMMDDEAFEKVHNYCDKNNKKVKVAKGMDALNEAATLNEVDIVVTSVVGMIGLIPTINAIRAKKDIALANKETLVVGGEIVMDEAKKNGVKILPVDSEHGAVFQCLRGNSDEKISKIILTASGGPFRGKARNELEDITPEKAIKHPKWNMGRKISIDSATLMNKGLEVIEAHWLFNVPFDRIQVLVHPDSIIHSMVEYCDGSVMCQMASTDMKLPIQYALNFPRREERVVEPLDFYNIKNLSFEKPDFDTFPCLKLAYEAGKKGGNMPTILNAANEEAVQLFLDGKIKFLDIENIVRESMRKIEHSAEIDLNIIINTDKKVRGYIKNKYGF